MYKVQKPKIRKDQGRFSRSLGAEVHLVLTAVASFYSYFLSSDKRHNLHSALLLFKWLMVCLLVFLSTELPHSFCFFL